MCVKKLHIEQTHRSKNSRIQGEISERGAVIKRKDKILLRNGRQDNAINGKHLRLALKENLAVFNMSLPRETER